MDKKKVKTIQIRLRKISAELKELERINLILFTVSDDPMYQKNFKIGQIKQNIKNSFMAIHSVLPRLHQVLNASTLKSAPSF